MAKRIAVEDSLENVRQALIAGGYDVTLLTPGKLDGIDAAVVSGFSDNFMGIATTDGRRFPVIEAAGLTAAEVVGRVEKGLRAQ